MYMSEYTPWDIFRHDIANDATVLLLCFFLEPFQQIHKTTNVPLIQRTCYKANQASENSSFIFTVCVRSVLRYHFKLAYVILQVAVKEFFETDFVNELDRSFVILIVLLICFSYSIDEREISHQVKTVQRKSKYRLTTI